jgi:hypothetical protein
VPRKRKSKKKALPKQYSAPKGSRRAALLKKAARLYKSGNKQASFKLREKMEERERAKKKSKKAGKKKKRYGNTSKKSRKK